VNKEMAAEWYHKAAEQGDVKAQYSLGLLLRS
jgi:TPR repeat protein